MENKKNEDDKKETDPKERMLTYIQQMADSKKAPVAKDLVKLKHVEVKKQEVSQETLDLAEALKQQYIEHDQFERLNNDEITILESFINDRMFLSRIAIVANQSRIPLGVEPFKKADLESILNKLISKGYIEIDKVGDTIVYIITERGKYRIQ
jgi:hypothetical protein